MVSKKGRGWSTERREKGALKRGERKEEKSRGGQVAKDEKEIDQ